MSDHDDLEHTAAEVAICPTVIPTIEAEPTETLEHMLVRHSDEIRDVNAKITALRKSMSGLKKNKKRPIEDKIFNLEYELNVLKANHEKELSALKGEVGHDEQLDELSLEKLNDLVIQEEPVAPKSTPKAQPKKKPHRGKQRLERREQELRRLQEEAEKEALNEQDFGKEEADAVQSLLESMKLQSKDIRADGHCLYNAISDQLASRHNEVALYQDLRSEAAAYMREHPDDFLPFLCSESGDMYDSEGFQKYCDDVQGTATWGGQPEIVALSWARKVPIHVIQMGAPVLKINEEEFHDKEPLKLAYYKHLYSLGAHYNSLREADSGE